MSEKCLETYDDPEQMSLHLQTCEVCASNEVAFAALEDSLKQQVTPDLVGGGLMERLPVAPWEGAGYRSWIVVAAVATIISIALLILSTLSEVSIVTAASAGMDAIPGLDVLGSLATALGELTGMAGVEFHSGVVLGFVLFNTLLLLLLRRKPRGYDV